MSIKLRSECLYKINKNIKKGKKIERKKKQREIERNLYNDTSSLTRVGAIRN